MDDSRLARWCSHLDDIRTEIADMRSEGRMPAAEGNCVVLAYEAINVAINYLNDAQHICEVCGGVGRVLRATRLRNAIDWSNGVRIPCPACQK